MSDHLKDDTGVFTTSSSLTANHVYLKLLLILVKSSDSKPVGMGPYKGLQFTSEGLQED